MHPKHARWWPHPAAACLIHYIVVTAVSVVAHDVILRLYNNNNPNKSLHASSDMRIPLSSASSGLRPGVAAWLLFYSVGILIWRLWFRKEPTIDSAGRAAATAKVVGGGETKTTAPLPNNASNNNNCTLSKAVVLYEYCWLCNVTLVVSAVALLTDRPVLAAAYTVTVGIDQLLWYADLIGYALSGGTRFVVGVAKYLTWPGNTDWTARITCTHHLWTIPLVLSACRGGGGGGNSCMHPMAYPLSFVCMTSNVLLSRFLTPSHVVVAAADQKSRASSNCPNQRYLNVNLSHALWKDITFEILQIDYDDPPAALYLFRLLWRWQGFNTIVFCFLYTVCRVVAGGSYD